MTVTLHCNVVVTEVLHTLTSVDRVLKKKAPLGKRSRIGKEKKTFYIQALKIRISEVFL